MAKNIMVLGETGCFWPKIALTAENSTYGLKFSYGRNFGYDRILAFLKPFLAVTVFRKKISFGHTLLHAQLILKQLGLSFVTPTHTVKCIQCAHHHG